MKHYICLDPIHEFGTLLQHFSGYFARGTFFGQDDLSLNRMIQLINSAGTSEYNATQAISRGAIKISKMVSRLSIYYIERGRMVIKLTRCIYICVAIIDST